MGRKHKFVNKTHYPDWAIERFTRCIFDDVLAFFATEERQREYEQWEAEQARQAELNRTKKRAASTALSLFIGVSSCVALWASIRAVSPSHLQSRFARNG